MRDPSFSCLSCGASGGSLALDLGLQPLANNLLLPSDLAAREPKFPLRLFLCRECWLLQIGDLVPPVSLFSDYLYFSSFSETLLKHARAAALRYREEFALDSASLVIEIASNDGYLLQNFSGMGVPCLGIEPAANIAKVAVAKGIPTRVDFFNQDLAKELASGNRKADLVLGNNVFAHVPDTNDFVAGLREILKPRGRIVLEFPYGVDMVEKAEFDTIYHEHVFYFTLTALHPLFHRHGLEVFRAERLAIHGGSLRLFAAHSGAFPVEESVGELTRGEIAKGVATPGFYDQFSDTVHRLKRELLELLRRLQAQDRSVAAYGASAKGSTLLNFFGIGREFIGFVADRSTYKHGRLTPGTHIPIVPAEELARRRPDYTLLLTWNFAAEILEQQRAYRDLGGKFIVPIPEVTIV